MRLVLFDVDGTLLDCGPQVRPLFAAALIEVYGTAGDLDRYSFAGKTDPRIVRDLMTGAGVPRAVVDAGLPEMRRRYLDRLEAELDGATVRVLPGVAELLAGLAADAELTLGLLTGNWERGARAKLAHHGLGGFFAFGAFGEDGVERAELPPVAMARAAALTGGRFAPAQVLIVGDSVEDVACARAHRVPCLAVATGWTPAHRLLAAGADWVVEDLRAAVRDGRFSAPWS